MKLFEFDLETKYCPKTRANLVFTTYKPSGELACIIVDAETGEELMRATVNMGDPWIPKGTAYIKSYSENEGLWECLLKEGIIEDTGKCLEQTFVTIKLAKFVKGYSEA